MENAIVKRSVHLHQTWVNMEYVIVYVVFVMHIWILSTECAFSSNMRDVFKISVLKDTHQHE